ncbi:protein FAR-RED ELONGATED HYPOCOTYL 3-like [Arachis hypogaea]|uniref:protein FAR-RED ELONGATED HYPOCOTYL 3-like n=1 Tax=Arachis hypogaea TaxID=3818 RepID=UPI003B2125DB
MDSKKDVPKVGMCFGTIEDANQFYQNYAKREEKRKSRVSPIEKTNPRTNYNCPARISIRLNKEGLWIISKVCLDHSHPCDPEMAKLLTRNREMTMHMCRVIERNDEAGVRPSKTYQVWWVKQERLKTIFWADARSRAAYEYFGDIVSFDTTYKTNRYDMPFGSFVGVNHHDIYEERHRWVPIFLDNFFWAGMRSTQRSESMHSYFDKFINNKSLLIQFVKQYDNCLGWKEQQEREADVEDYKSIIPCATNSLIEKQFQGAYTNAKFKEVQKQFRKKANCILHLMKAVSTSKVYSILEDVSTSKERVYEVNYNAEMKDITYMCQMFELRGILCRHSLVVLGHERVREIPRRYILDRWSKLVKRRHSDIKSSHDPSLLNPKTERFDDLCSHSNSVAQFASQTKETSDILHRYLDMAMAECQKHVANSSSNANELDNLLTSEDGGKDGGKDALSIFVGGCIISIQYIKSPPYVFTKGRPTNRLGSEKDKMIKKKTEAKKRKSEITEKEDNQHIGDIQSLPFNEQLQDANYNVNEGFESDSMGASMGGFMSSLNSIHSYQFSNVD